MGAVGCRPSGYLPRNRALYADPKLDGHSPATSGHLDAIVPIRVSISFVVAVLPICSGAAAAPRFKLTVALILAAVPLSLAYQDYANREMGLRLIGPYEQTANELFSFLLNSAIAFVVGVIVAWGLILWGYFRRRQAGLASR